MIASQHNSNLPTIATGSYAVQSKRQVYENTKELRPWLPPSPPGGWKVEDVDEEDFVPRRNYRAVYKWAQRVSKYVRRPAVRQL